MSSPSARRRPPFGLVRRRLVGAPVLVLFLVACIGGGDGSTPTPGGSPSAFPRYLDPSEETSPTMVAGSPPGVVALARSRIKHVVFVIKENRTYDTLFGRFPGADGATEGKTCDGQTVPLRRATDSTPDVGHSFIDCITAVIGGGMYCFDPGGYIQYRRSDIPNYWAYAKRYALADRFFSSVYGPTGIEHLWTFASQSNRFIDHERPGQLGSARREWCDDPLETALSFPVMARREQEHLYRVEDEGAAGVRELRSAFVQRWPCIDVRVLPDELQRAGISWKEYRGKNPWVQPLRMVLHVRF